MRRRRLLWRFTLELQRRYCRGGCAGGQGEGACCGAGAIAAGFGAGFGAGLAAGFLVVRRRGFFGGSTGVSCTITGFGCSFVLPSPMG
jgi:hypothetical protein